MMVQLSSFPLGSSAGGFTYSFDDALGTFRRTSSSFGPSFAERATTIGRGKLSAGVTYQHSQDNTFESQQLDDGSIKFYLASRRMLHGQRWRRRRRRWWVAAVGPFSNPTARVSIPPSKAIRLRRRCS